MRVLRTIVAGLAFPLACNVSFIAGASAAPSPAPSVSLETPRFVRVADLDTDVTVRYTMKPSPFHGEADPGPFVGSGLLAIRSGRERIDSIFPFAALGVTPPNVSQIVPSDPGASCGVIAPIAIVALAGSVAPAVVFTSVAIGKGCLPIVHVLLPLEGASHRYGIVSVYASQLNAPDETRGEPVRTIRIRRVRDLTLPELANAFPKAARNEHIAIVDGIDESGRRVRIALDFRTVRDGAARVGSSIVVRDAPNGYEGAEHAAP